MIYVTDTHPLVWLLDSSQTARLSVRARRILEDTSIRVVVPAIVLAEIFFLHSKRRISVSLADAQAYLRDTSNRPVHVLDETVVSHLPETLNIHDAIIVATALVQREEHDEETSVITKNGMITSSGLINIVW